MTVTAQGFTPETLPDLLERMAEELRAQPSFGPNVNLTASGRIGQLAGVVSEMAAVVNEDLRALDDADDVDNASGEALDVIGARVGVPRLGPVNASAVITATGTAGTVILSGRTFANGIGERFESVLTVTIPAGGTIDLTVVATEPGPRMVDAGTITQIVTPVFGLASVTNAQDGDQGSLAETDAAYRLRIKSGGGVVGRATLPGIVATLRAAIPAAVEIQVFQNVTDTVDGDGLLPHSIAVVVRPNTVPSAVIAPEVFAAKGAGINTSGGETATAYDSQGRGHVIRYSYADPVSRAVIVDISNAPLLPNFPADGVDQIEAVVAAYFDALAIGDSTRPHVLEAMITNAVPGIGDLDVTIGGSADPVAVAFDEIAVAGSITVTTP